MFIDELPDSTNIQISLISNEKIIQLESTIRKNLSGKDIAYLFAICQKANVSHFAALNDIFRKNKSIGFSDKTLNYTIFSTLDNIKRMKCENVKILRLSLPDSGPVNILFCNTEMEYVNQRHFYRVDISESAVCRINGTHQKHNVLLKDLSIHGMGFIMKEEHVLEKDDDIELCFFVEKNDKITQYVLHGKVVHASVMRNGKFRVGCFIPKTNNEFLRLLNRRQIENIQKKKNVGI